MLVSYNWLKEFVDIELSPQETADLLTMGGVEVEGVTPVGQGLEKIFTAKVEEVSPHPSADKLTLVRISLGDREETVVCGAPNVKVGQLVPYAAPGVTLPSGLEISARKVRGVMSPGMICSERELELSDDHSGILELDPEGPVGASLTDAFPFIEDYILETGVTPNRGDCLSILGTAREVAALTGKQWRLPEFDIEEDPESIHDNMVIEVPDADLCLRYVARMVKGVSWVQSPLEVRLKLVRAGVRPISAVVDVTNIILLECGQPQHAFDYSFLDDAKIVVRRCDPGEEFVTLDGEKRKMPDNALMIRDGIRSVGLAGIMGGLNSEITENTTDVLIESACFESIGIRKTAKFLGMSTEASFRFERGVDPEGSYWSAQRAVYLIQKLAGGAILSGTIDVYPKPVKRNPVKVRPARVNKVLGIDVKKTDMTKYLKQLGIEVKSKGKDALECAPPSWRWDLEREEDMIEEVARVYGFQNIPVTLPTYTSAPDRTGEDKERLRRVASLMTASGFTEAITMSFVAKAAAEQFVAEDIERPLALINPLTEDYVCMRTSLVAGLVAVLKRNISFKLEDLRIFEIGRVFSPRKGQELPNEPLKLAGVMSGARYPDIWHFHRGEIDTEGNVDRTREVDFYDVKGALENLLEGMGITEATFTPSSAPFLHPGKSADVSVDGEIIGYAGELSPAALREHDLARKALIFEILLEPLLVHSRKVNTFRSIPRYPYIERDLSFIVEEKVSGDEIKHLISRLGHDIITSVALFDFYRGESIPEGYLSMAFRIRYQSEERTLTDEEAHEAHMRIADALTKELGAKMRE